MQPLGHILNGHRPTTRSSSDSRNTPGDEAASLFLRALEEGTLTPTIPDEEPPPVCPTCLGFGYLRRTGLPVTDPDFGTLIPCACLAPVLAQKRLERLFGGADFPPVLRNLDFGTFAATRGDQAARARVESWATAGTGSLYLFGKVRRGKTGLALAAFRYRLETTQTAGLYKSSVDLLDAIRASFDRATGGARTSEIIEAARTAPLLVLDDLGKESVTDWVGQQVYGLVDYRWRQCLPTIVTSNYSLLELGARFKEHGEAIAWRLKAMCHPNVIHVQGPNLDDTPEAHP